jgi:hypothetical protein
LGRVREGEGKTKNEIEKSTQNVSPTYAAKCLSPSLALPEKGRGHHPHCHCLLDLILGYEIEV